MLDLNTASAASALAEILREATPAAAALALTLLMLLLPLWSLRTLSSFVLALTTGGGGVCWEAALSFVRWLMLSTSSGSPPVEAADG